MRRWFVSIALIAALLSIGALIQNRLIATAPQPSRVEESRPPLRVDGIVVHPTSKTDPLVGFGTVRSERTAVISAQVGGEVIERTDRLRVGREVPAGAVLLRIDPRDYQRQLDRARSQVDADDATLAQLEQELENTARLLSIAESELQIADRDYERVLGLFERTQAPRRELDIARQTLEAGRRTIQTLENARNLIPTRQRAAEAARALHLADVELAKLNLERCTIAAPFAGRIEAVQVEAGERVIPGQQLFALLDPADLEIPLELAVSQRDRVTVGTRCRISTEAREDVVWEGRVARIAPSANPQTRTFSAFLEVDAAQAATPLLPGMFVRAEVEGPTLDGVLVVPRGSIVDGNVFTASEGHARVHAVEIDRHLRDESVIRGIAPGTTVIVSNLDVLYDGCPVEVREVAADTATAGTSQADPQRGPRTAAHSGT